MKTKERKKILIVGAGFSGAVIARELAEAGKYQITVIDSRDHIAGNCYDTTCSQTGNKFHKYGPHIFHTNNARIFDYLSQFTEWTPYKHEVQGSVEHIGDVPIPVNIDTVNMLYGKKIHSEKEYIDFLESIRTHHERPENSWEHLTNIYGEKISELFFSRYTKKMWGLDLKNLPISIVSRIPVRTNKERGYFNDSHQYMPKLGYTHLFTNMLTHENIDIHLNTQFDKSMETEYSYVFNAMPIDVYFDHEFGELPYRSIIFDHRIGEQFEHQVPTINFTDNKKYTRKTNWDLYPGCGGGHTNLITYEIPCDYKENNFQRYYPVKTIDGEPQKIYSKYKKLAKAREDKMIFIGRCGQYIYYDMHQVVANSLNIVKQYSSCL